MKAFIKLAVLLLFLSDCSNNQKYIVLPANDGLFTVDLDNGEKRDTFYLSTLFESVKCIPLELTDNSLIGQVTKVLVHENSIYVLDIFKSKGLFVFDQKGNFTRRIGNIGTGQGEYVSISDFTIDTDNREIIILATGNTLLFFDLVTGQHKKTVPIPNYPFVIQYFNGVLYTDLHEHPLTKDDCLMQIVNLTSGKQEGKLLKTNEYNKGVNERILSESPYFIPAPELPVLFRQTFMDIFFALTPEGVQPFLKIKSKDFVSQNDIDEINKEDRFSLFPLVEKNKIYSLNCFKNTDFIYFIINQGGKRYFAVFDMKTNTTQIFNYACNDLVYKHNTPQIFFSVCCFDTFGVYELVNVNSISSLVQLLKDDSTDGSIKEQLKDLTEESNPVLFYYQFK